ncbi:MAG TPA: HAD-IB family hydrolase [Cytophagales bacterium]|jgi:phosphatidylglycerophosphatase C|nr:HAD-IB family hydrolase [Cytophagales bacterium]
MKALALFDFDGTITRKDSLLEFLKYKAGSSGFYAGMFLCMPYILYCTLIIKKGWKAKERVLQYFLKGQKKEDLYEIGTKFRNEIIPGIVEPAALEKIKWHQEQGHRVVIVSASLDFWLKKWTDDHGLELIATEIAFENGKASGKFATPNCNGMEKVRRIKEILDLNEYKPIYAYGNSHGDMPMINLADYKFYKYFF